MSDIINNPVEAPLNAEMEAHLGYPKHSHSGNSRNGYRSKSLKGDAAESFQPGQGFSGLLKKLTNHIGAIHYVVCDYNETRKPVALHL